MGAFDTLLDWHARRWGIVRYMMKRRDLVWITNEQGDTVSVGIVEIDTTAQTVTTDVTPSDNERVHIVGVTMPQLV